MGALGVDEVAAFAAAAWILLWYRSVVNRYCLQGNRVNFCGSVDDPKLMYSTVVRGKPIWAGEDVEMCLHLHMCIVPVPARTN